MGLYTNDFVINSQVAIQIQRDTKEHKELEQNRQKRSTKASEQERYALVQRVEPNPSDAIYSWCVLYEYHGFAIDILPQESSNTLVSMQIYNYHVDPVSRQISSRPQTVTTHDISHNDHSIEQHMAQVALYSAFSPLQRARDIYKLVNLRIVRQLINSYTWPLQDPYEANDELIALRTHTIRQMIEKQRNKLNHIDRVHAQLLLHNVNVSDTSKDLHPYINSVYVNIVYNCTAICVNTVLSDRRSWRNKNQIPLTEQWCTHRILDIKSKDILQLKTTLYNSTQYATESSLKSIESCLKCVFVLNIQNFASIAVFSGSIIALLVAHSGNKCARAIRSCCAAIMCATSGARTVQQKRGT